MASTNFRDIWGKDFKELIESTEKEIPNSNLYETSGCKYREEQ
jgi:hypothetical protein